MTSVFRVCFFSVLLAVPPLAGSAKEPVGGQGEGKPPAAVEESGKDSAALAAVPEPDRKFLKEASAISRYNVRAGEIALFLGSSDQVKDLARRVVDDHTLAVNELKIVARAKGVKELPDQLDAARQRKLAALQESYGDEFDRKYASMMAADHENDLRVFQQEAGSGSDPQLKEFAAEVLPKVKDHLSRARAVKQSTNNAPARTPKPGSPER